MPLQHAAYFTGDQWAVLQELSGQRNPASYIREVVDRHIRVALIRTHDPAPMHTNELFEGRWKAIGCAKRVFDDAFNTARDWYVKQFDTEEEALTELEERHAHESLNNPRGWIYKQWYDAGRPGK